jgi:uncharacterized membrane protein
MVLAVNGPQRLQHSTPRNVGDAERVASVALGGMLAATGLKKRGLGGLLLALAGAELIRRGSTGHCMLYDAIGFSSADSEHRMRDGGRHRSDLRGTAATVNARKSIKIERSVIVDRPRTRLYEFWRDFQNLPRFFDHLQSVTVSDSIHSHWVARGPGNACVEWDAEIVNDIPDELIAWKTIGNPDVAHAGSVHFTDAPDGEGTTVRLVMDYEPPGGRVAAVAAKFIGESPDQKVRDDLRRLKTVVEMGEASPVRRS